MQTTKYNYSIIKEDIICVHIYVMRKPWIETIHGLRCSKYGSVLCAGNPWIAQHLRDPWIAQPHMCQAFVQKKGSKVISREKGKEIVAYLSAGDNKGEQVMNYLCYNTGCNTSDIELRRTQGYL